MKVSMMDEVDYTFEDSILYSSDRQKIIMCSKGVDGGNHSIFRLDTHVP